MKTFLTSLSILIAFAGCRNNKHRSSFKNEYGGRTNRIFFKKNIIADSAFDLNHQIKKVITYFDNNNGNLANIETIQYFKNGLNDSTSFDFYTNGNPKTKKFYYCGREEFERIQYFENGKPKYYLFTDSIDQLKYVRQYDSTGKYIKSFGSPFFIAYLNGQRSIYSVYDTVKAIFYAPTPPIVKLRYTRLRKENLIIILEELVTASFSKLKSIL